MVNDFLDCFLMDYVDVYNVVSIVESNWWIIKNVIKLCIGLVKVVFFIW